MEWIEWLVFQIVVKNHQLRSWFRPPNAQIRPTWPKSNNASNQWTHHVWSGLGDQYCRRWSVTTNCDYCFQILPRKYDGPTSRQIDWQTERPTDTECFESCLKNQLKCDVQECSGLKWTHAIFDWVWAVFYCFWHGVKTVGRCANELDIYN